MTKRRLILTTALSFVVTSLLLACAPKSPDLMSPPDLDPNAQKASAAISKEVKLAPKVDILFVMDTSDSMSPHQENLKLNINRFVDAFKARADIDFHIGVVSVYDSKRFGKVVPETYPLGKLRPLRDPTQPGQVLADPSFVSLERFKDMETVSRVLGETLKVGIEPRFKYALDANGRAVYEVEKDQDGKVKKDEKGRAVKVDGGGPEDEETFTPVEPALLTNAGFYRKDAHLAVIMITDADDASGIQFDQLRARLIEMKGNEPKLLSAYAALSLAGCAQDPGLKEAGGDPRKIKDFVGSVGGKVLNLCDERYGDKLAEVGAIIQEKASQLVRIQLKEKPEVPTLKVTYEGKPLPPGKGQAWSYDEVYNKVVIRGDHPDIAKNPGGKLEILYIPIDMKRVARGRVIPVN